jgi:HK97 gp10 family phage protein
MSLKIDPDSRRAVMKIKGLKRLTKEGVELAAWKSARGLRKATSDEILKKPKGGRVYVTRNAAGRRRRHRASAPGETHANFSGKLRRSSDFKVNSREIEFGYMDNPPDYAEHVEFGTKRMKPRPSLRNGIKGQRRNFQNNFEREINKKL